MVISIHSNSLGLIQNRHGLLLNFRYTYTFLSYSKGAFSEFQKGVDAWALVIDVQQIKEILNLACTKLSSSRNEVNVAANDIKWGTGGREKFRWILYLECSGRKQKFESFFCWNLMFCLLVTGLSILFPKKSRKDAFVILNLVFISSDYKYILIFFLCFHHAQYSLN